MNPQQCVKNWKSAFKNKFLKARNGFFFNFDFNISSKMKFWMITKDMQTIQPKSFLENWFYGQWSSQRPSASVKVKNFKVSGIFQKKNSNFSWISRITFFLIFIVKRCFEIKNFPMKAQQLWKRCPVCFKFVNSFLDFYKLLNM